MLMALLFAGTLALTYITNKYLSYKNTDTINSCINETFYMSISFETSNLILLNFAYKSNNASVLLDKCKAEILSIVFLSCDNNEFTTFCQTIIMNIFNRYTNFTCIYYVKRKQCPLTEFLKICKYKIIKYGFVKYHIFEK